MVATFILEAFPLFVKRFLISHQTYSYKYSPNSTYLVKCIGKDQDDDYHGLQLFRVADGQLIGQVDDLNFLCLWGIQWAPDESALSFVVEAAEHDDPHLGTNIYVWNKDGTAPYIIGNGSFLDDPGTWSPDLNRLVVEILNPHPTDLGENTYQILHLDGRPPNITNAPIWGKHVRPGLDWVTNKIIEEPNTCCGGHVSHDYYVAETGENLTDLFWADGGSWGEISNQDLLPSPDERWLVVDKTDHDPLGMREESWEQTLTYVLYDFQAHQPYTLSATTDLYLNFVGWADDSSDFYLVRRPITDTVIEQPETPFGLLVLDPTTRQLQLLNPTIRYAWLSPDKQHIFGYSQQNNGLSAAIYNLDGSLLTAPQPVLAITSLDLDLGENGNLRVVWSNDGTQVVFNDPWGNLWLANINGSTYPLAFGLPLPDSKHFYKDWLYWSPDDAHLLLTTNDRAWVLYLP